MTEEKVESFGLIVDSTFHRISLEIVRYELITRICKGVSLLGEGIYQCLPRVLALLGVSENF